jgi:hypothetical protein
MRPNYEAKESLNLQEAVRDLHARLMVLEPKSVVLGNTGQLVRAKTPKVESKVIGNGLPATAPLVHPPNTVHQ